MKIYYNEFKGHNPAAKAYKVATTRYEKFIYKLRRKDGTIITKKQRAYIALAKALAALSDPNSGVTSATITITKEQEVK